MNSKKKILYLLTQTHYGGAQKYVHDMAMNLLKSGHFNVTVAVGEGDEDPWLSDLRETGVVVIRLKHVKRNLHIWHDFISGFELYKLYKKIRPDIIHLNSSKIGAVGSVVGWLYKKITNNRPKIIYTVHGLILNEPLALWRKVYYWLAEKIGAMFKDILICVSEFDKQSLLKWQITKPGKIKVIHNGINLDNLNFLSREEARKKISQIIAHDLQSTIIIGTVAGLYKTKGLKYLIAAADQIIANLPFEFDKSKIKFLIIGSGPEKNNLELLIRQYKLQANVILAGYIDKAQLLLKAFDIFVLPSVKEGLSYTLIEAQAAQLPIITTSVGGNPEIIEDNKTGVLVPPANAKLLAKELSNLIQYENIRKKFSHDANINISKFSLQEMTRLTTQQY